MTARLTDAELAELERRKLAFEQTRECVEERHEDIMIFGGPARAYFEAVHAIFPRLLSERASLLHERGEFVIENGLLRTELAALRSERDELRADKERIDWLEGELSREIAALERDHFRVPEPEALFRQCVPITRETIDAARARHGTAGSEEGKK